MTDGRLDVSSELYNELLISNKKLNSDPYTNLHVKFLDTSFLKCHHSTEVDKDGDLIVERPPRLMIEVSLSSQLSGVGLQLWRGALLLSDYLIHNKHSILEGKNILELAAGVGLTSIVASLFAERVISTDIDRDGILERIRANFKQNNQFVRSEQKVLALDFFSSDWSEDLHQDITNSHVVIAGDVIYDNDLTEAFVKTLTNILMTSKKTALIALEKRYVFTIEDLDSVAPCYEHFLQTIKRDWNRPPMSLWTVSSVPIDFPQYLDYERNKHLVLWKIES